MQINLMSVGGGYRHVVDSLITPIRQHLPESNILSGRTGVAGDLNLSFFVELEYSHPNVVMSHGISDKNYMKANNLSKFDYILVPGNAHKEKIIGLGVPASKIFIVGWPRLDPIFQGRYKRAESNKIRVLYAPTHNFHPAGTDGPFSEYLGKIPASMEFAISPHPCRKEDRSTTMQAYVDTDVVISDASSTIYEAWSLGKPVIFPDWMVRERVLASCGGAIESEIYQRELGYHARSFEHLIELIPKACKEGLSGEVVQFIENVFPATLRGKSGKATADVLRAIASKLGSIDDHQIMP